MKLPSKLIVSSFALAVAGALTGCAVTPAEVNSAHQAKGAIIEAARTQAQTQRAPDAIYSVVKGNYLGGNLIVASTGAALPAKYRDVSHNNATTALGTFQVAVNNIQNLGLSVRVNADVTTPISTQAQSAAPTPALGAAPTAPGAAPVAPPAGPNVPRTPVLVPLNFKGDLSDYINQITSQLGVSWEYNPTANEVHIFRSLTRTCTVMNVPGAIDFDDKMSGGGNSAVGAGGSGGQGSSFGSTSSANIVAKSYDSWDSLVAALNSLITPSGKLSANPGTGTVVVTDAKEGVDRVCGLVASENARMNLQVAIDVREISVQLNDGNSLGIDLNLVYQQLNAITGAPDWVFKYNSPTNLTDSGSGSVGFNVARPESRLAGSNIAAQALASFGRIVSDKTDTILTRNRVPGRYQRVIEQVYLASTTPAAGSSTGGGAGVPGLTPGVVSYGSTITIVPTVGDNNQVVMHLFDTQSDLLAINSVATGTGATFQQINTPALSKRKFAQSFSVQHGETLIIVGSESDSMSSNTNAALSGASNNSKRTKGMSVLMVTPRVMTGS